MALTISDASLPMILEPGIKKILADRIETIVRKQAEPIILEAIKETMNGLVMYLEEAHIWDKNRIELRVAFNKKELFL